MIRFFAKLLAFLLLTSVPFFHYSLKRAKQDSFYWKTTRPAASLIIGASRAQMGIDPEVIEKELELDHEMINIAFSGTTSPYGAPYLKLIKRKLESRTGKDGIFILSVTPCVLASYLTEHYPVEEDFRVYDMWNVNLNPNLEFVARNPRGDQLAEIKLTKYLKKNKYTRDYYIKESRKTKRRTKDRMKGEAKTKGIIKPRQKRKKIRAISRKTTRKGFRKVLFSDEDLREIDSLAYDIPILQEHFVSQMRLTYLRETVDFLSSKGSVFLIRTPETESVIKQSYSFMPNFTAKMRALEKLPNVYYFDYSARTKELGYHLFDYSMHLEVRSARAFSRQICEDIKSTLNK